MITHTPPCRDSHQALYHGAAPVSRFAGVVDIHSFQGLTPDSFCDSCCLLIARCLIKVQVRLIQEYKLIKLPPRGSSEGAIVLNDTPPAPVVHCPRMRVRYRP